MRDNGLTIFRQTQRGYATKFEHLNEMRIYKVISNSTRLLHQNNLVSTAIYHHQNCMLFNNSITDQTKRYFQTSRSLQNTKDYYKILGVSKNSSQAQIRKAYFAKARKYHPDRNKNDPEAKKKFLEISEAYVVLGDRKSRSLYNRNLRRAPRRSRGAPSSRAPPSAVQAPNSGPSLMTTAATAIVASELYNKFKNMGQNPTERGDSAEEQQTLDAESAQKLYEDVERDEGAGMSL
ncbi:hypothetical protein LSTR_LSTR016223, partial [Laodelphax striatellus]